MDYLKSSNESLEAIPVFKLSDIKSLYSQRLKEYGSPDVCVEKIHSTRLKEKILGRIPELHESRKGRDVILTFREEIGSAIYTACNQNYEEDGTCLSSAAKLSGSKYFSMIVQRRKVYLPKFAKKHQSPGHLSL